jgi:hypothetical protein
MRTVIHRDGTFTAGGRTYAVIYGGRGWGYEIVTYPELRHVADGFFTLAEVRDFADGEGLTPSRAGGQVSFRGRKSRRDS